MTKPIQYRQHIPKAPSTPADAGDSTQVAPSTNEDNQPIDQGRGIERQTDQQKDETKQRRKAPWGNRQ